MSPLPSGVAVLFVRSPESYPPPSREAGGVDIYRYRGHPFRDGPTPNRKDPYYYRLLGGTDNKVVLGEKREAEARPKEDETGEGKGERIFSRVKVARATNIEPGTHRVVECISKRAGLVVVQPYLPLYERHGLTCTNGVVQVEPDWPFRLLIANFREYPVRVQKGQVVAELLPHPRAMLESKTTIGEVLGIEGRGNENFPNSTQPPKGETRCEPSEEESVEQPGERSAGLSASAPAKPQCRIKPPPPDVEELDLSYLPDWLREKFRRMLKKYSRMWDGTLGEINTTVHRMELIPETRPIAQAPYRAEPKAREI